ncbi:MAG TPA: Fe(3+) ABC transporter substrate-binding protein [Gammaproteobacteria bacterium]|nr:Fe(3+) ABC transporter substrate-binding protein [Gammaproteobacteria bacterium]
MKHLFKLLMLLVVLEPITGEEVVNAYSARHYDTDQAMYDRFTAETGIEVNLIEGGSDALIERIKNEGQFSPADMLITVDAGRLWRADQEGIFQPVDSEILEARIPSHLRHPDGHWFGLSKRARVIAYNSSLELSRSLSNYEDLSDEKFKGQICMRSSGNIYNLSLMASLIDAHGVGSAEDWARSVVANFARNPQSNDTGQLRAVASGECALTVANTYYLGRLLGSSKPEDRQVMANLKVVFPNQDNRGTHVNISGAGITKHAPNKENAIRFLEYLTSEFAQKLFAEGNNEYPVVGETTGPVAALGKFKSDNLDVSVLGERQAEAVKAFDRAGWN